MSLEQSIQNLADAINKLVAAQSPPEAADPAEPAPTPARRGRPAGSANKPKDEAPPPAAPVKPAAAAAVAGLTSADVRKSLIQVVTKIGKEACTALCEKHGAPNLSGLDPSVYDAIVAEATQMLAEAAEV